MPVLSSTSTLSTAVLMTDGWPHVRGPELHEYDLDGRLDIHITSYVFIFCPVRLHIATPTSTLCVTGYNRL